MPDGTCHGDTENREPDKKQTPHQLSCPRAQTQALRECLRLASRAQHARKLAPPRTLSPKAASPASRELQRAAVGCFPYIPQPKAQGWVPGRVSGCTCWIRSSQRRPGKQSLAGPAASCGVGRASSWGGAPGAKWRLEQGGAWWFGVQKKQGREANPDFLSHPG